MGSIVGWEGGARAGGRVEGSGPSSTFCSPSPKPGIERSCKDPRAVVVSCEVAVLGASAPL